MADRTETEIHVEVTGWDVDDESISWDGYGQTEDAAVADALERGRIVEIGDVRVIGRVYRSRGL